MLNFLNNKKSVIIIITVITVYAYYKIGNTAMPIEDLGIASGISVDTMPDSNDNNPLYKVAVSLYTYPGKDEVSNLVLSGEGMTVPDTRETRQLKSNKKFVLGFERVVILSEAYARLGLKPAIDILFANRTVNDTAMTIVCKGDAEELLKYNIKDYPSSADYIDGLVHHIDDYNFFSNNYKILDLYVRLDAEGRNIILPYVEIKNKIPEVTGLAMFKKDKMVEKLDIDTAKILSLLREDNVSGLLELQQSPQEYISLMAKSKRKVKCQKKGDKYSFTINLSIKGEIITNSLYDNIKSDNKVVEKFQSDMSKHVENLCNDFISKMQNDYKCDCLQLGRVAAAKYGRGSNIDWDKIICNSEIKVNVKVEATSTGRGNYWQKEK